MWRFGGTPVEFGFVQAAYIAFEGKVYDVSRSFLWQRGRHQVRHQAGIDYTDGLGEPSMEQTCLSGIQSLDYW